MALPMRSATPLCWLPSMVLTFSSRWSTGVSSLSRIAVTVFMNSILSRWTSPVYSRSLIILMASCFLSVADSLCDLWSLNMAITKELSTLYALSRAGPDTFCMISL